MGCDLATSPKSTASRVTADSLEQVPPHNQEFHSKLNNLMVV